MNIGKIFTGSSSNAYKAPDISYLRNYKDINFLKDFNAPGYFSGDADTMFQDYLKSITSPEALAPGNDYLKSLMDQVDIGTNQAVGSGKMDFLDRGLGGPGQMSDIEAVALAQTRGEGQKQKTDAATQLALQRSGAMQSAYGTRYGAGVGADQEARNAENEMKKLYANLLNSRDLAMATGQLQSASDYAKNQVNTPGLFETMLRRFGNSAAETAGGGFGGMGGKKLGTLAF